MTELFRTIHGSHLYGLAHPGSDLDMFIVTDTHKTKAHHGFDVDGTDLSTRGLDQFLIHAASGSHQSVEALFSPFKEWTAAGLPYRPMLESMLVTGPEVLDKYVRTIKQFCYGDFKRRRHAGRLALNMVDLRTYGRFTPVLSPDQIERITFLAQKHQGDKLRALLLP